MTTARQHHGNTMVTSWQLRGTCMATARRLPGNSMATAWHLHGNSMARAWQHHGNIMATARRRLGHCMATARELHGNCMATSGARHPQTLTTWPLGKQAGEGEGGGRVPGGGTRGATASPSMAPWLSRVERERETTCLRSTEGSGGVSQATSSSSTPRSERSRSRLSCGISSGSSSQRRRPSDQILDERGESSGASTPEWRPKRRRPSDQVEPATPAERSGRERRCLVARAEATAAERFPAFARKLMVALEHLSSDKAASWGRTHLTRRSVCAQLHRTWGTRLPPLPRRAVPRESSPCHWATLT